MAEEFSWLRRPTVGTSEGIVSTQGQTPDPGDADDQKKDPTQKERELAEYLDLKERTFTDPEHAEDPADIGQVFRERDAEAKKESELNVKLTEREEALMARILALLEPRLLPSGGDEDNSLIKTESGREWSWPRLHAEEDEGE